MLYLDSSALVKLVVHEPESAALRDFLTTQGQRCVTSALARVEVVRAVAEQGDPVLALAALVLSRCDQVAVTVDLLDRAARLPPPALRSLDAIHLASASRLQPGLTSVVAYDRRLLTAADEFGLPTTSPGQN